MNTFANLYGVSSATPGKRSPHLCLTDNLGRSFLPHEKIS